MPIIPTVGRKAWRIRLLFTVMYTILTLGAVTMVYPFLLMLATSITSSTDTNELRVIPRYLHDERALFTKYIDDKYAGDSDTINNLYHTSFRKVEDFNLPTTPNISDDIQTKKFWSSFVQTLPIRFKQAGFRGYGTHPSQVSQLYRDFVRRKFHNDILLLNKTYIEENDSFETVLPPMERPNKRNWNPDRSAKMQDFIAWKTALPEHMKIVAGAEPMFADFLREDAAVYKGDVQKVAIVWPSITSFDKITLPATPPKNPDQLRDWEDFVRHKLPFRYIAPSNGAVTVYRKYLRGKYADVAKLNQAYYTQYRTFEDVPIPTDLPEGGSIVNDWGDFIARVIPTSFLCLDTPENRFRTAAKQAGIAVTYPPYYLQDAEYVHNHASELRHDYMTRNYRIVIDYILLHGRALTVTIIFCLAVILTTLIVNPMCAYALSRYSLPYAYKVLLFLLATMAFPAEVAMIPNFLLLKQLGLLNTYWALILPGMASSFSIFLLKGFFDSLPKELYEAGTIDGASEVRMLFNITIPLSKPIFAVIALQAFTGAYGAFMFALLVCQNPKMWTIMVWLYELQISNPQYIMMAGLTVAALPTLLVFIFAQNIIMRGIILPSYK